MRIKRALAMPAAEDAGHAADAPEDGEIVLGNNEPVDTQPAPEVVVALGAVVEAPPQIEPEPEAAASLADEEGAVADAEEAAADHLHTDSDEEPSVLKKQRTA